MRKVLAVALLLAVAGCAAAHAAAPRLDDSNSWAFRPAEDPYGADPLLDLRYLNEETAGQSGYVRLSEDGEGFVRGDGEPIRFWGVHATSKADWSDADAARNARWLARLGVNLVRCGGSLKPKGEGTRITDVNETALREAWRTVAVMKREGIYTMYSPFWAYGGFQGPVAESWGIEGYSGEVGMEGLLWFEPTLQAGYKAWVRRLLTEPNPYTGIPLKDDPALAFLEVANEDNMLFYWVDRIKGGPRRRLEGEFARWAAGKYGSVGEALAAWDNAEVEGDAPAEGRLGLMVIWFATWDGRGKAPNALRVRDQLQFYAETQRAFGLEMKRYFADELGCGALMDTSNFRPADQVLMGDLGLWCKSAGDLICANSYYDPGHRGENAAWRVDPGHFFVGASALTRPLRITVLKKQLVGRPYVLTETLWVPPMPYEAEAPLLLAAYMGLNGLDAALVAGPRGVDWNADPYYPWWTLPGGHPMPKFNCVGPATMGSFPAAALIHRLGYVATGPTVVHERRSMEQMLDLEPPMIADAADFDPNQYAERYRANPDIPGGVRPEAFLVGRVEVAVGDRPAGSRAADLSPFIEGDTVRSATGELTVDSDPGLFILDAPRAQAAAGFLRAAGGRFELSSVTIESGNDYAVVIAVPLDGRPLAESERVLVQVGTVCRPTDWSVEPATHEDDGRTVQGYRILTTGSLPWRVTNADVTVTIRNPNLTEATRLDPDGFAEGPVPTERTDGTLRMEFPQGTMHVILQ